VASRISSVVGEDSKLGNSIKTILTIWIVVAFVVAPVHGQGKLGTFFKKRYTLRSVTCNACHVKDEEKDVLNPFGKKVAKVLEGKNVTERIEAARELEYEEDREEAEDQIAKVVFEALKKLDIMKAPSGKTYAKAIRAGEVEGTKLPK